MHLDQTMRNYREGSRHSTIVMRIAKGYTDHEIGMMSACFAALPWTNAEVKADPAMVKTAPHCITATLVPVAMAPPVFRPCPTRPGWPVNIRSS